ncbi:MAG: hypothetical protein JW947_09975 [Sedimentisphaerales bacterium]|nr:hypothetical protein [Sedimentisphaerales bacterium]
MKRVVFMIGLLFIAGCANCSSDTKPVAQCGGSKAVAEDKSRVEIGSNSEYTSTLCHGDNIKFEKASTLGRGNHIKVKEFVKVGPNHSQYKRLKGKPVLVTIGWISKGRDSMYRYYEPVTNELNPTFTEKDIEVLKDKIRSHHSRS